MCPPYNPAFLYRRKAILSFRYVLIVMSKTVAVGKEDYIRRRASLSSR